VVDGVDQHRDAERVRQQDELLAARVALVPGRREELDPRHPLRLGELGLAHEGVQVGIRLAATSRKRASARGSILAITWSVRVAR
jgi:hypothetical protein